MDIKQLRVGLLEVNCYILTDGSEAAVIDPGAEAQTIIKAVEECGATLTKILLTHGHFDHIGAVCDLAEKTGAKVYIHSEDRLMLMDNDCNLSFMTGEKIRTYTPDILLDNMTEIPLGSAVIKVYHTPGHSAGSVSFLCEDNLFDGDLLFRGSIGRYDFGDLKTELESVKFLLDNMEDHVKIYPGHGESTTIGYESKNNPYVDWIDK